MRPGVLCTHRCGATASLPEAFIDMNADIDPDASQTWFVSPTEPTSGKDEHRWLSLVKLCRRTQLNPASTILLTGSTNRTEGEGVLRRSFGAAVIRRFKATQVSMLKLH